MEQETSSRAGLAKTRWVWSSSRGPKDRPCPTERSPANSNLFFNRQIIRRRVTGDLTLPGRRPHFGPFHAFPAGSQYAFVAPDLSLAITGKILQTNQRTVDAMEIAGTVSPVDAPLLPVLRAQIQAFRYLGRGAPLPAELLAALDPPGASKKGKGPDSGSAASAMDASFSAKGSSRGPDPISPALMTEKVARSYINSRIAELESLPGSISMEPFSEDLSVLVAPRHLNGLAGSSAKIKTAIELKALRLLDKQKRLREEIARCLDPPALISTAIDRREHVFLGKRRPDDVRQPTTARGPAGSDRREKISQQDFIASITGYAREFKDAAASRREWFDKLGQQILKMHQVIEKEEAARVEMERSERLRALRENGGFGLLFVSLTGF